MMATFLRLLTGRLRVLVAAVLSACVLLGFGGAVAQFALKHAATLGAGWGVAVVYLAVAAGLLTSAWRVRGQRRTRTWLLALLGVSAFVRLAIVVAWHDLPQTADRLFIVEFVDRWVRSGDDALRQMSHEYYDYPLWTGRAWPVLYPLRVLFPERFILATQLANVLMSTALIAAVSAVVRRAAGLRMARLAAAFTALSPAFAFSVLDYGYQFQGALLVLAALAAMAEVVRRSRQRESAIVPAAALLPLMFLLHLQQGLDLLLLAVAAGAIAFAFLLQRPRRECARVAVCLLVPAVLAMPFSKLADTWFQARDEGRLSSHLIGHAALGWNLVTWGEFHGTYLELDRAAPAVLKSAIMTRAVLSNIRTHPVDALLKLPPIKIIKFMQVGAATGIEEAFSDAGSRWGLLLYRGSRLVYALVLLGSAGLGTFALLRRQRVDARLLWMLFFAGTLAAYTFMSETSPRYSFYVHFILAAGAAQGVTLATRARAALVRRRAWTSWFSGALASAVLLAIVLGGLAVLVRRMPAQRFFLDLCGKAPEDAAIHAGQEPWDVTVSGSGIVLLDVPVPTVPESLSFFAWSAGSQATTCSVEIVSAAGSNVLGRVDLPISSRCTFGSLHLERTPGDTRLAIRVTTAGTAPVRWGFASLVPST